jgi:hypothetical protein
MRTEPDAGGQRQGDEGSNRQFPSMIPEESAHAMLLLDVDVDVRRAIVCTEDSGPA